MNKIKENILEVKNSAGLTQYFVLYLYYKNLEHPVTFKIYPHEFDSWDDLEEKKKTLRSQGHSLAHKLYKENEFKKRQLDFFSPPNN